MYLVLMYNVKDADDIKNMSIYPDLEVAKGVCTRWALGELGCNKEDLLESTDVPSDVMYEVYKEDDPRRFYVHQLDPANVIDRE